MQVERSRVLSLVGHLPAASAWSINAPEPAMRGAEVRVAAKERMARLARALESDVIPRLVQAHRVPASRVPLASAPDAVEIDALVALLTAGTDARIAEMVSALRSRGVSVESLYLDFFAAAARRLGEMWNEDLCEFPTVTVALGRLQRLLRELSPAFGIEVGHPANGRRALFAQPRDEQHSFGLSMVAEFFRRDGWDVLGGVGGAVADIAAKVREEWVDIIGLSIGVEARLPWLRDSIRDARAATRNPDMRVIVGGPIFSLHPQWAAEVGADGTACKGNEAPLLAERLMATGGLRAQS